MKIIVAHPGRQHSFRLASALKKAEMLDCYVTTIYDKESSVLMKVLKKFLSKDNRKRANGRKNKDLTDEEVVLYCRFGGLLEAFLARIDKTKLFYSWLQRVNANRFGKKVAKLAIKRNADAVITYDCNALKCFELLEKKAPKIRRIMDVSSAARPYRKKIYEEEIRKSGHSDLRKENIEFWSKKKIRRFQKEIDRTQFFLTPSQFVQHSLIGCGVAKENIYIVPYGANVSGEMCLKEQKEQLKLLFVGNVNYNKGISYLIDAISTFSENEICLTIVGQYDSSVWYVKRAKESRNVTFTGRVTFDKMKEIYQQADVFIIDSFAEGMAQVGIEAMACGLPIICSQNSGVSDLVTEGQNGFIIPCGNVEALKEKIGWFLEHRNQISKMGESASEVARKYSWGFYEYNVTKTLNQIVEAK